MLKLRKANSILKLVLVLDLVLFVLSVPQAGADDKNVRLIEAAAAGQTESGGEVEFPVGAQV